MSGPAAAAIVIDAIGQQHQRAHVDARIVSLVPSITELLIDLDLGANLVGRTGFCIHPREQVKPIAKVGGTKDVKLDRIRGLAPSHVVVNIDENTRETYTALKEIAPHVIVTHPNGPTDNIELFNLLGFVFNRDEVAAELCRRLHEVLQQAQCAGAELPARRVLYLIWRDPWMTVTRDTYIANMLGLVNWRTVPTTAAARYPALDDLSLDEDFDVCLLSSEPYAFREKHVEEVRRLTADRTTVRVIDGEMISWYGSRAIAGIGYLTRFARELQSVAA